MIDLLSYPENASWGRTAAPKMKTAFIFALTGHVLLLAVLLLVRAQNPGFVDPDVTAVRRALSEIAREANLRGDQPAVFDLETLARSLGGSIRFSDEKDLKKKVEIVKAMLQSFFRAGREREGSYFDLSKLSLDEIQAKIEDGSIRLPDGEKMFASPDADSRHGLEFHTLRREEESEISRLARKRTGNAGLNESFREEWDRGFIPPEIYYRECPYERILARGADMFTVVSGLPEFVLAPKEKTRAGSVRRETAADKPETADLLTILLPTAGSSFPGDREDASAQADLFSPAGMAAALDLYMKKPEGEQFADFKKNYLERFDPDSPELAELTRLFIASNLNGVLYAEIQLAKAYDSLEELYYKRPIYDAYLTCARRWPGTRVSAEFLFSLAAAYDFERRTLALINEIEPEALELLDSGIPKSGIYDGEAKAYVLQTIVEKARLALGKGGPGKIVGALKKYHDTSVAIYRYLAETGGDIRDRAFYALGTTAWEDGEFERALSFWRNVRSLDESEDFRFIKLRLDAPPSEISRVVEEIRRFLAVRADEEDHDLLNRQLRFHKWATRAKSWADPQFRTD